MLVHNLQFYNSDIKKMKEIYSQELTVEGCFYAFIVQWTLTFGVQ